MFRLLARHKHSVKSDFGEPTRRGPALQDKLTVAKYLSKHRR